MTRFMTAATLVVLSLAVVGGVAPVNSAAGEEAKEEIVLPWGATLADYQELSGDELRRTVSGQTIRQNETLQRSRLSHPYIEVFCEDGRYARMSPQLRPSNSFRYHTYRFSDQQVCITKQEETCMSILKAADGTYLRQSTDRSGAKSYSPILLSSATPYCRVD